MQRFWDLLEQSTLVSGLIAVALVGAVIYLAVTGQPIPDLLSAIMTTVIGFFFGAKSQKASPQSRGYKVG